MPLPLFISNNSCFRRPQSVFNVHFAARCILVLELIAQVIVVITEGISNSQYRKFPASDLMIGYTGQSLLVIIVGFLQLCLTSLILRNSGYILSRRTWKLSVSGIGVSAASICFRSFSSWFIQDPSSAYYIGTYNITSICIVLGAIIWIPFGFCRSHKYVGGDDSNSTTNDNHRSRIISTGGPVTYRPNNEESNIDGDELPSYYEMISPPPYKSKRSTPSHRDSALLAENETSPSTRSDIVHNDTLSRSNGGLVYNDPPLSFTPNPTITIVPAYTATARDPIP